MEVVVMKKKPMPIGIEEFKEIIDKDFMYIDKTLAIKEILANGAKVTLFTRPRRFGKTLFQKMLQTFFEDERKFIKKGTFEKIDNRRYFEGLKIMNAGEKYMQHQGKYPVVFLSLKSAKQPNYRLAFKCLKDEITKEYMRNMYILESETLLDVKKERKVYECYK